MIMTTHNESGASDFGSARRRRPARRRARNRVGPENAAVLPGEVLTLSSPADVRSAVPYLLGFTPERSLVFLALGTSRDRLMVTGRIDAPADLGEAVHCADSMASAILHTEARRVIIAYFGSLARTAGGGRRGATPSTGDSDVDAEAMVRGLAARIDEHLHSVGIDVIAWVWEDADGDRRVHAPPPIAVAAVTAGRRIFGSRAEVAELVAPRPSARRPVIAETIARLDALRIPTEDLASAFEELLAERGRWPDDACGLPPLSEQQVALCCLALDRLPIRDAVIGALVGSEEPSYEDLWCDVLHRAPEGVIAPVASVLAIEAYMHGNGVLARCALDRALRTDPGYSLARLVMDSLNSGLPPDRVRAGFASAYDEVCGDHDARQEAED